MTGSKPLIILGSSRGHGETRRAIDLAFSDKADCIDLLDYEFSAWDYQHTNRDDDFHKIVDLMLPRQTLMFATPVYWYSMSAILKTFMDRLSDLITIDKKRGRSLAGKTAWLIASGTDKTLPEGYEIPFLKTCAYFNIAYRGCCYLYTGDDPGLRLQTESQIKTFGAIILTEGQQG